MAKQYFTFSKELFVQTMDALQKQYDYDVKHRFALEKLYGVDMPEYKNHCVNNQLIILLQMQFNDNHAESWIEYFITVLDFGRKYKPGCAKDANGDLIDLSNAVRLYEFLLK